MNAPELAEELGPTDPEKINGETSPEPRDDFTAAAEEAFPEFVGSPDRIAALKEAIRICLEGDYEEKESKPPSKEGLALIFGPGKPKK